MHSTSTVFQGFSLQFLVFVAFLPAVTGRKTDQRHGETGQDHENRDEADCKLEFFDPGHQKMEDIVGEILNLLGTSGSEINYVLWQKSK